MKVFCVVCEQDTKHKKMELVASVIVLKISRSKWKK